MFRTLLTLAAASLFFGCLHPPTAPSPIDPEDFTLTIETISAEPSDDGTLSISHHLTNHGPNTVCLGGSQRFAIDGKVVESRTQMDVLCQSPELVVAPGQTASWTRASSMAGCWPDAPDAILESMPRLKCGTLIEVTSWIWLFRLEGGVPQFGGVQIASQPLELRTRPSL